MHTDEGGVIMCLMAGGEQKRYDLACKAAGLIAELKAYSRKIGYEAFITSSLLNFHITIKPGLPES